MSDPQQFLKGIVFFAGFLPSFTRIGLLARRAGWAPLNPDFNGQTWLVTGASTGIGREIAAAAARAGAAVHGVARSADKLEQLAGEARAETGRILPRIADLSLVGDTRALVSSLREGKSRIDVLVNNVGVLLDRPATTAEGLDAAFAVNLLNQFVLTEGLRDAGLLHLEACVISMTSGGLYNVPLSIDALQSQDDYDGSLAYANHKRAQAVLTAWWRRSELDGTRYYVMHPGWVDTPGVRTSLPEFHKLVGPLLRTPADGADTALWLAVNRPSQDDDDRIWFDRAQRSPHLLWGTRAGDRAEDLVGYLRRTAASVGPAS